MEQIKQEIIDKLYNMDLIQDDTINNFDFNQNVSDICDSIDKIDLFIELEKEFETSISDIDLENAITFNDVVTLFKK